ncbi:MAG: type II toxin-antitoxin system HicB family antitoxin [Deltaproteobacteria bacterium]|nr:type II toxin-antitoxin system HicB family antitoxin [Deltaproteobacteria bacterium]OIP66276.1 MAG: hypothetical protein AUK30_02755 [Nitrospirae bacterium CG2_30_70_394]PIU78938.1 MAG: type II toxin-antitoxin system HicB family antitoxin [Nitrospirae bacterium CG06_land_8_20_14_3_00_70_43]PIW83285.1 MAG: type II toxin-antitoxin system HicB family antitoxin [Nitrospirae bacterium CG_4_8_14_3_um_filter_70_85]PIX82614.1 MAG: type II toxin-antitoxin system HicB family antitoxin [Nitrospirae bac
MADYVYTIALEGEEDGGFHAFWLALKGCHAPGDTLEEAIANVREAIALYLERRVEDGEEIPQEALLFQPLRIAV